MGNYINFENLCRNKALPTHAYHPNAALMAARRQAYIAVPAYKEECKAVGGMNDGSKAA